MSIELQKVTDEIKEAFEHWRLLIDLTNKAEAVISASVSRVERGSRLRQTFNIATGKNAALMVKATEFEGEAFTYLTFVPGYRTYFKEELKKVRGQIEGGIRNE